MDTDIKTIYETIFRKSKLYLKQICALKMNEWQNNEN
jgi:hypothetical protein